MNKTISKYQITVAEFFPTYGVVTKHDRKQFGEILTNYKSPKTYRRFFPSKDKAINFINNFNKRLDKKYTVRFFSEAQFILAKQSENYRIHYTRKQWNETLEIGYEKRKNP